MSGNKKEEALIHVQGLGKSFGAVDVLKDISVDTVSYTHLDVYKRQEERAL